MISRAIRLIMQPEREWAAIGLEHGNWLRVLFCYLAPLALIAPIAYGCAMLFGDDGALRPYAGRGTDVRFALLSAAGGFTAQLLGVLITALVVYLVTPLYRAARDFDAAFRLVAYAATPLWLAGILLAAPLQRFPLLVVIILMALMHASFLFYLGLHYVAKVPQREAAECAAIVLLASLLLSTVVGYAGGTAGFLRM